MYHVSGGLWGFAMPQLLQFIDVTLLTLVALWNFGGHWFPWRIIPFLVDAETGQLHRIVAYAHGCFTIWCSCVGWALARHLLAMTVSPWDAVAFHGLVTVAAGIGTVAPRIVRWIAEAKATQDDVADYEQAISSRR